MNTIVRWVSIKRKDIPCYSCGVEECKIQNNLMNNEKNWNYKLKKFKTVIKCSGYKEQLFDFNKEYWNSLYSFIYDWCDKYCGGKHNITQSNDGFDFMMEGSEEEFKTKPSLTTKEELLKSAGYYVEQHTEKLIEE